MIKRIYYQNKQVLRAFLGDKIIISIAPKLSANFISGEYKQDGAPCSFTDLFNFTRAGKAWLVKDTGLQEYAADVPRLDNGLLIEQSATNLILHSLLPGIGNYVKGGVQFISERWRYNATLPQGWLYPQPYPESTSNKVFSIVVPDAQAKESIGFRFGSSFPTSDSLIKNGKRVYGASGIESSSLSGILFNQYDGAYVEHYQVESSNPEKIPTSPIVTTTSPVTRPADLLLNKITGTAVTGDWDSTLSLSIVAGKLVHSGYGRIRSLEIN